MSRDEFINTTQRSYEGVTEREFYQAAERLFTLSDGDDTTFAYPGEHSMVAQRNWMIYLVLSFTQGTHTWQIATEPTDTGLDATVYASIQSGAVHGMIGGRGGASTSTIPTMQNIVNTPAVYELFWSRMDYLLGKSESWPTCDDWKAKLRQGETYGLIEPLCLAANTDDLLPEELR
ncbi:hypothetical protein [Halomonas sp. LBP4]|uniref:hypothetical protein n=1 Tax=Halomonas sp. LBP4 TaxID=2044917 RepID=UPI0011B4ACCE|nr:hypothetical protein [Halomonas sp. LBP4]